MALSYMLTAYGEIPEQLKVFEGIESKELYLVTQATLKRINAPLTSSCGRLFDAVAALLGLRAQVSFEGQAAMLLEMISDPSQSKPYPFLLSDDDGRMIVDPLPMIDAILKDCLAGRPAAEIGGRFHVSLASMIEDACIRIRQKTGLGQVVLSGGVFQNALLTEMALTTLGNAGFKVLTHSLVPPNDGGIALGQAAVATC